MQDPNQPNDPNQSEPQGFSEQDNQEGLVQCEITGQWLQEDDTIELHGYRVGPEGKALLLQQLESGEALPGQNILPSKGKRFLCYLLDSLIVGVVGAALGLGIGVAFVAAMGDTMKTEVWIQTTASFLGFALGMLYFGIQHAQSGQTVGKRAGNLKVLKADGSPLTNGTAFARAFWYTGIYSVPGMLTAFWFAVPTDDFLRALEGIGVLTSMYVLGNAITVLVRQDQRAIHDLICKTQVVEMPR